jgi:hypothetical protein
MKTLGTVKNLQQQQNLSVVVSKGFFIRQLMHK